MAIAVSPPVALPPRHRVEGLRRVAISLPVPLPGDRSELGAEPLSRPGALVAIGRELVAHASGWPGMTRPDRRRWALMAATDAFEAWVIAWPPGGAIDLHDHGASAGAVVVVAGQLRETSIVAEPPGGISLRSSTIESGRSISFGAGHVHDIVNEGRVPAISVHVYAPRLSSMTYYRITEGVLEAGPTVRGQFDGAAA